MREAYGLFFICMSCIWQINHKTNPQFYVFVQQITLGSVKEPTIYDVEGGKSNSTGGVVHMIGLLHKACGKAGGYPHISP